MYEGRVEQEGNPFLLHQGDGSLHAATHGARSPSVQYCTGTVPRLDSKHKNRNERMG
jgi:hypothetical protein